MRCHDFCLHRRSLQRLVSYAACWFILICLIGCGNSPKMYSVQGIVALRDGTPLANCRVVFNSPTHCAKGISDPAGHYRLATFLSNDGAIAGDYQIIVAELPPDDIDAPAPLRFNLRYTDPQKSGLSFTVGAGSTICDLILDPPAATPKPAN